jgi:hypothetical protein
MHARQLMSPRHAALQSDLDLLCPHCSSWLAASPLPQSQRARAADVPLINVQTRDDRLKRKAEASDLSPSPSFAATTERRHIMAMRASYRSLWRFRADDG